MAVVALTTLLDQRVVELNDEYVDKRPVIHWETVYGFKYIYRTKHYLTHGGNPTGGYVYCSIRRGSQDGMNGLLACQLMS